MADGTERSNKLFLVIRSNARTTNKNQSRIASAFYEINRRIRTEMHSSHSERMRVWDYFDMCDAWPHSPAKVDTRIFLCEVQRRCQSGKLIGTR